MNHQEFTALLLVSAVILSAAFIWAFYMPKRHYDGLMGEALIILYSSLSIMILLVLPLEYPAKFITALIISYSVSTLSRLDNRAGYPLLFVNVGHIAYMIIIAYAVLKINA